MVTYCHGCCSLCFYAGFTAYGFGMTKVWVMITRFVFVGQVFFFSWFLLPLWILGECDRCPFLVSLSCSAGMFSENVCWCWRLGSWDDGREVGG